MILIKENELIQHFMEVVHSWMYLTGKLRQTQEVKKVSLFSRIYYIKFLNLDLPIIRIMRPKMKWQEALILVTTIS